MPKGRNVYKLSHRTSLPSSSDPDPEKQVSKLPSNQRIMKIEASNHLLVLSLTLWGVKSIGTTEPDGTPDPSIPPGFFAPDGEIDDLTILHPAPEFPAPPNGTPNISSKSI